MPTPSPGWNLVPRWRTMISPPVTVCPAKIFTPRRWAVESRPLGLGPRALLLGILGLLFCRGVVCLRRACLRRPRPGRRLRLRCRLALPASLGLRLRLHFAIARLLGLLRLLHG